jgi:hypothetical protein
MRMANGGNGRTVAVMATTRGILCYYPRQRGRAVPLQDLQKPRDVTLQVPQIPRCAALQDLQRSHDVDIFDGAMFGML